VAGTVCKAALGSVVTAGGKLGVDWQNWLVYGIGGAAFNGSLESQLMNPTNPTLDDSSGHSAHGWYAGGGIDYMLAQTRSFDFIIGAEYEHIDLGTIDELSSFPPPSNLTFQRFLSAKEDIAWAKVTVKFNPPAP
jgi:opacity protein-like surface antigen